MTATPHDDLARRVVAREPSAVARAISVVEDRRPTREGDVVALLAAVRAAGTGRTSHRVGITGPPGVGKSTLVSAIVRAIRRGGRTVGVLAVDPSSPRSGGALLGDRARIELDPGDAGTFVRSMASGGYLGGLARAAAAAVDVLGAAFDVVLVETTGVGQSETDVEHVADTVVLVVQPGSGDVLQFLKAGILEIPDVLVVNKSDLGALAERAAAELVGALAMSHAGTGRGPATVLKTSATSGAGVEALVEAIDAHRASLGESLDGRRQQKSAAWALRLYTVLHGEIAVGRAGGRDAVLRRLSDVVAGGASAVEAVAKFTAP